MGRAQPMKDKKDESPLIYRVERVEVSYDVSFASPAFDLPSKNVQLLRALYEIINPRFPVNASSMQVFGGNNLGDVKVRMALLNNNALVDIDVQRMYAVCTNIKSLADIEIVKDCLMLAEDALKVPFPDIKFSHRRFEFRCHATVDGGRDTVSTIINRRINPLPPIDIGAEGQNIGLVVNYEHQVENWRITLMLDQSQIIPEGLYIYLHALYICDGGLESFEAQEEHLGAVFEKIVRGLNLRAANS